MHKILTPNEIADLLNINYRKVLELILLGDLNAFKVGRQYRVTESDLESFINSNKV